MKTRWLVLVASIFFAGEIRAVADGALLRKGREGYAPEFELTDQHAKTIRYKFPRTKISVLVVADHGGSSQVAGWIAPIYEQYEKKIEIAGIAFLPGIPAPFHSLFRRSFGEKLQYPVMMDWAGDVSKTFGGRSNVANLYIIDLDGKIIHSTSGEASDAALKKIYELIDRRLQR